MNPRKKSKPNPQAPADDSNSTPATPPPAGTRWLSGTGSWRSKAPAIVKTARESIAVTHGATGELPADDDRKPKDDSPTKFLTKRKSSKGDAIPASMTKVTVSSDRLGDHVDEPPNPTAIEEPPLPPDPVTPRPDAPVSTWAWRSWWSRPDGYADGESVEDAKSTPLPGPTPSEEPDAAVKGLGADTAVTQSAQDEAVKHASGQDTEMTDAPATNNNAPATAPSSGSWFWRWSNAQNAQANAPPEPGPVVEETLQAPSEPQAPKDPATPEQLAAPTKTPHATPTQLGSTKPSAWAFWYRGKPAQEAKPAEGGAQKHVGEVAVYDTPSQSHPEAAQFNEQEQPKPDTPTPAQQTQKEESLSKRSFRSLRGRPKTNGTPKNTPADTPNPSQVATPIKTSPVLAPTRLEVAPAAQLAPKQATQVKQEPANLLLPGFNTTYRLVQQPSFWQQVRQYFLGGEPAAPHLHINPAPPRIKKAVAIGIHGFFPAPIFQKVLGQPTGTSIRFANAAAAAIKEWSAARGYEPEIEQIALEGEGFIAERVNSLWKLLLNWIEHIKAADFILVACHSQGVPVSMMLVAKLIQFGCVNATRIGVCAMAGVNMGPFIEYKTKYFGPTAAELFEFSNPKSLVSQMYLASLDEVLRFGVRILYVGSIDDQLVSLEVGHTTYPSLLVF